MPSEKTIDDKQKNKLIKYDACRNMCTQLNNFEHLDGKEKRFMYLFTNGTKIGCLTFYVLFFIHF